MEVVHSGWIKNCLKRGQPGVWGTAVRPRGKVPVEVWGTKTVRNIEAKSETSTVFNVSVPIF